jgi:uncharacterized membrane protein YoaK (UPF0700 family)
MKLLSLFCVLIAAAGILILLKMSPFELANAAGKLFHKRKTVKQKILAVQKPKKVTGIRRVLSDAHQVLVSTNQEDRFSALCMMALILGLLGVIIAVCLDNLFLVPVLAVGCALLPFLYVIYSSARYRRQLNVELQSALSLITTNYQRSQNLIAAVKENIDSLNPPISDIFKRFLIRVESIDPDIPAALESIKPEINNSVWQEWIDALILCQHSRTQISTLPYTVAKISRIRKIAGEMEVEMYKPVRTYLAVLAIVAGMVVAICCLNSDWRGYLLFSTPGKIILAITTLVVLITAVRVISLTKPPEYERGDKTA